MNYGMFGIHPCTNQVDFAAEQKENEIKRIDDELSSFDQVDGFDKVRSAEKSPSHHHPIPPETP